MQNNYQGASSGAPSMAPQAPQQPPHDMSAMNDQLRSLNIQRIVAGQPPISPEMYIEYMQSQQQQQPPQAQSQPPIQQGPPQPQQDGKAQSLQQLVRLLQR